MNDREQLRERMAELGRASGEARRRRRSRGFLDVWKGRAHSDPDELYDALARSTDGAVVIARILEKAGALVPEPEPMQLPNPDAVAHSIADVVRFATRLVPRKR